MTRMETLNKYLEQLLTIKNSPQAVASTKYGNVPFNESTLASILLNNLPIVWRNQYNVTHPIVPESLRAILLDLENLEKVFVEKSNEAARANKAKVAAATKMAGEHVPRNGKRAHGGGPEKGTPKKGRTNSFANDARLLTDHSPPTTPLSVVGSTRMAAKRTGRLSPSTPQRSPGRNQEVEIPLRWLI
jgi:hypothetical protein